MTDPTHPASTDTPAKGGAMTTPDTLELLRKAAERAKPYWGAVDMMLGGNPIAADIVTPFAQSISPDVYIALLDRLDALEGRAQAAEDETDTVRQIALTLLGNIGTAFYDGFRDAITREPWDDCYNFAAAKGRDYALDIIKAHRDALAPTTLADEGRDQ